MPLLAQLQADLTKAKAVLELAKGGLQYGQAIVQNLNPCLVEPPGTPNTYLRGLPVKNEGACAHLSRSVQDSVALALSAVPM